MTYPLSPPLYYTSLPEVCVYPHNSLFTPPALQFAPPSKPYTQLRRLISKAAAFQPQEVAQVHEPNKEHYKKHIAEVIHLAKVAIKRSEHVKEVDICEDGGCWSINIQPQVIEENSWQTEVLMTLAKKALLDASLKSKCIYVMGYCTPQPFNMRAQGFKATLGVMYNASSACWHVFKKGFCRHGDDFCKQHPACQVPVHVLVEGVQLQTCTRFAGAFKEQMSDIVTTVTAALGENPHVELVEAFKDKDYQGWSIELTAKEDLAIHKDYLLTLAKNALFGATGNSELIKIIGYAAKPFVQKSRGFVTILGDMQDESRVFWDMYSKGTCSRDCGACRWEHPECLMPINVVVKQMSCPILPICPR